ncbi:MAG TPA: cupin domain-containing protein [Actinophytocola sp.]|uniref:cupin domain-containing protein n=1 Tax=Actinophytocola sp. TaxID=1872138 RepID=UPI002DDD5017|nr:cupin domain-containing protein [Actinophytocola sp.]HEV2777826.1 cupin domain-containing protein [Actinophytocola sp.]
MTSRHVVGRAADARYVAGVDGFSHWPVVDETTPAVHTGFHLCALEPGGFIPPRVQSFEESVYIVEGSVVLRTPEGAVLLGPGDYALLPVGFPHGWHNEGGTVVRWARMLAPQPRARFDGDTFAAPLEDLGPPRAIDVRDPRNRLFGHIDPANMDPSKQTQDLLAQSASMRTALLVYSGITVKMMVDSDLGAQLQTMFMVQYEPHGVAGPHDHPFEETYYFLEGEGEATFDGQTYRLGPGDVAFAGVGCVHGFRNVGAGPLRWLETQAPAPPGRHSYRFVRDWDYLRAALEGSQS